jgi:hypothetical protein
MTLQVDTEAFSVSRVRDEAITMVRSLIRLVQTMKPLHSVGGGSRMGVTGHWLTCLPSPPPSPMCPVWRVQRRVLQLKLFYYDDRTPDAYQPPHFTDSTHMDHPFFAVTPLKISVGGVASVSAAPGATEGGRGEGGRRLVHSDPIGGDLAP